MKKVLTVIIVVIVILLLKVSITFTINELVIQKEKKEDYDTSLVNSLYILNVIERYVAYYNHGNLLYQKGQYKEAEEKYQQALRKNPPSSRTCDIQINLTLAKVKQIDMSNPEKALEELKKARSVLYENHCADAKDDSGESQEAEELEEEIKEKEKELGGSGEEDPNEKDPEGKEEEEKENGKEKEIEEKLKENRQDANENRQDVMQYFEDSEFYLGDPW